MLSDSDSECKQTRVRFDKDCQKWCTGQHQHNWSSNWKLRPLDRKKSSWTIFWRKGRSCHTNLIYMVCVLVYYFTQQIKLNQLICQPNFYSVFMLRVSIHIWKWCEANFRWQLGSWCRKGWEGILSVHWWVIMYNWKFLYCSLFREVGQWINPWDPSNI